jgi:hypothetical protein
MKIKLGKWFLWERGIRLRLLLPGFHREWYFGVHPPWEER